MKLNFNKFSSAFSGMIGLPPDESSEQVGVYPFYPPAPASKPTVLVYGHDEEFRCLLKTLLGIWKYVPEEDDSVEKVLTRAQLRPPNLIIVDAKFVFSITLSEMIKMRKDQVLRSIPFIMLSGHAQKDIRRQALLAGAAEFLVKPLNYDRLEKIIKSHLFLSPHSIKLEDFL